MLTSLYQVWTQKTQYLKEKSSLNNKQISNVLINVINLNKITDS